MMATPTLELEALSGSPVAGVDEAGRGPWAGPVIAAAVILDQSHIPPGIDDSKKLSKSKRQSLAPLIEKSALTGIGAASVAEIDDRNILAATLLAMERAVAALAQAPAFVLVDGNKCPAWSYASTSIIRGDTISLSIAAASIIAKVTRDRIMADLAADHPGYGWETNA